MVAAFDDMVAPAWAVRERGDGDVLWTAAGMVRGDATEVVAALVAVLLLGAGEFAAFVLGADVREVPEAAVGGLVTDRETGRVAGEATAFVRGSGG